MGRRASRRFELGHRCERCRMLNEVCLCEDIPNLRLQTRLVLIMHRREVARTTATGRLAVHALPHSELHIHGHADQPVDLTHLFAEERRVLLLFPFEDAVPLGPEHREGGPVTLVVPDGSWKQARRAARRVPGLDRAERVCLPDGPPTAWGLRQERRSGGLATLEAIARALGILESVAVQQELEELLAKQVSRSLWTRQRTPDPELR